MAIPSRTLLRLSPLIAAVLYLSDLTGCKPPEDANLKAIVGALLIDGTGGPPISNSVVLISGTKIASAGARTNIVIPQGTEEIDGAGRSIIPALINIYTRSSDRAGVLSGKIGAGEARRRIVEFVASHRQMVLLDGIEPAAEEAALDESRKHPIPVFGRVTRLADARRLLAEGVAGFVGMIADTEQIDPAFIAQVRDLRVVWAPALVELRGTALEIAQRNTKRLSAGGVWIGVAGEPIEREMELLVDAGLTPGEAILAATRNAAVALRSTDVGTLEKGKQADLILLPHNPLEDIRNVRGGRQMRGGAWIQ